MSDSDGGLFRSSGTRTLHPDDEYSNTGAATGWRLTDWTGENVYFKVEYDVSGDVSLSTKDQDDILVLKNDGTGIEFGGTQSGFALDFIKAKTDTNGFSLKNFSDQNVLTLGIGGNQEAEFLDALSVVGDFSVNTNKFTLNATTGNMVVAGTSQLAGDVTIATGKTFTVTDGFAIDASGNAAIVGGLTVNTDKFTVASASGNTLVAGTLNSTGDFNVNTGMTVAAASGNTSLKAGATFGITSGFQIDASGNVSVTGNLGLAAGKTFGITSGFQIDATSNLTGVGNVTLEDDKNIALSASGTALTSHVELSNSNGDISKLLTVGNLVRQSIEQSAGSWGIGTDNSAVDLFVVDYKGIITGTSTIPSDITTGAVNGKVFNNAGELVSSRSENSTATHHSFYDFSGGLAGAINTDAAGGTIFSTTSDPRTKIELARAKDISDEYTNEQFRLALSTVIRYKRKCDESITTLGFNAHDLIDSRIECGGGVEGNGPRDVELGSKYDTGKKDEEGNPIMGDVTPAGVGQDKMISLLMLKVDQLERRLEAK